MTLPVITLMSGIQTEIDPDICFTLDSTDLGVLDTDILAGTEDTQFVAPIQSLTISRGRSRQLDRFTAGTASILFDNRDRKLDPLNTASDYYGYIVPRLRLKVLADNIPIYSGYATDWEVEYDKTGSDTASVACVDAFTIFANFVTANDDTPAPQTPGPRLQWIVDIFAYKGSVNFGAGNANLGDYTVPEGTQMLEYMTNVAASDRGALYVDGDGVLQYVGRFDREAVSEVTFADDGSGVPYMSLVTSYNDELLYNEIIAASPAGSVIARNEDSIASYELSSLNLSYLLNNSTFELQEIADFYLEKLALPQVRFTGLTVELAGLSAAQIEDLLNVEIADQISVKKSFSAGLPAVVTQDLMVSGIQHRIQPGSHMITFTFEPTPYKDGLKLDDATRGTIDSTNYLG